YQGTGQYKYPAPYFAAENGPPNFLMRNNRDGTFRDVTAEAGLNQNNTRYSFCCAWGDPDGTGWPSLYVVNDFGRKNLYRNNGNGTFTDVAAREGIEDIGAGMSVCWFDYDNDGAPDLYVSDMWTAAGERISAQEPFQREAPESIRSLYRKHAMGNSLFRNQGNGSFQETMNFEGGGMGRWSWSSDAWDFDHDGFNDLYVTNGMLSGSSREDLNSFFWRQVVANSPNGPTPSPEYEQGWDAINELIRAGYTWSGFERNVFYANNRDGTFSNVSAAVGLDCIEDSRAFALADFDHDGRLEVLLKNRNAPQLRLLKNVRESLPPSIAFRLHGVKCNRGAIGAAVTIETESGRQTRWLQAGSGFLSQHSKDLFFGLGNTIGVMTATIRWPDGTIQQLRNLPINHRIWVEQGAEPSRIEPFRTSSSPPSVPSQHVESLPIQVETWLLAPVPAPDFSLPDSSARMHGLFALRGKPVFLSFQPRSTERALFRALHSACLHQNLELLIITFDDATLPDALPVLRGSNDVAAVYNTLFRYLYDSHRDLTLPTSFLINPQGEIVKIYQGPANPQRIEEDFHSIPQSNAERLSRALPFSGNAEHYAFARNNLSLGSVFFQRGCFGQAELFFRLAIQDDPASAEAHYGLGSVYLAQQRNTEAQASFEQSIKLRSNYPDTAPNAWNNLGLLATRQGRTDHAIVCFEEALRQNPEYWIALENLGNAYRQQKQWTAARTTLERALAMRPKDPEANYSLAMIFAQTDDTARAYEYLQKALELRPDYSEALNNLGILYLRTRRRDDAVAAFEKCIRVAPGFDQAYLNLARVYRIEGAPEKARAVLVDLLKQHPDHALAQQALHDLH
ncbi:MAG: tetratricopeptide repeat protein, partial [Acidobacteriaceae bacterium]|nr:tetratricopeptide repeat protein [Acidobacteriaceae bacterium]